MYTLYCHSVLLTDCANRISVLNVVDTSAFLVTHAALEHFETLVNCVKDSLSFPFLSLVFDYVILIGCTLYMYVYVHLQ